MGSEKEREGEEQVRRWWKRNQKREKSEKRKKIDFLEKYGNQVEPLAFFITKFQYCFEFLERILCFYTFLVGI